MRFSRFLLAATSFLAVSAAHAADDGHHHHEHSDHAGHSHGLRDALARPASDGLSLGGFLRSQANIVDQDLHPTERDFTFMSDTEIHIRYQNTTDRGLRYGAIIELEADISEAFKEEGENADKTTIFLETGHGKLELGNQTDAGHQLSLNPSTQAKATGGIHGDYEELVVFPHAHGGGHHSHLNFIHKPSLVLASQHEIGEDATKISLFSPILNGFQGGVSFIPDSGNGGTASGFTTDSDEEQWENVVNAGLQYHTDIDDMHVGVSLIGEIGEAEDPAYEDLAAYEASLELGAHGFVLSGSYGSWGDSAQEVTDTFDDGVYWAGGLAYDAGAGGVSVTYLNSELKNNQADVVSVGAEYYLASGLTPYAEVTFFDLDHYDPAVSDTDGSLVIIGTALQF